MVDPSALEFETLLSGFEAGEVPVGRLVAHASEYDGFDVFARKGHLLWEAGLFYHCLQVLSLDRQLELLRALIQDNPSLPIVQDKEDGVFLHVAVNQRSRLDVVRILAAPGTTRIRGNYGVAEGVTPLHLACSKEGVDPEAVEFLMDADPGALRLPCPGEEKLFPSILLGSTTPQVDLFLP